MDEYFLKARFEDAKKLAFKGTKFMGFFDPAEAQFLKSLSKKDKDCEFSFWGGYEEAERVFLAVSRDYITKEEFPLKAITISYREVDKISHRDFLGAFMSQGVERAALGDMLIEKGRAVVFVREELTDYFLKSITKIASHGVKCSLGFDKDLPLSKEFLDINGVIASNRADAVIAFLIKSSREKAALQIKIGNVNVNYTEIDSLTHKLCENDKISIRGHGKFIVEEIGTLTKKGRMIIKGKKYI